MEFWPHIPAGVAPHWYYLCLRWLLLGALAGVVVGTVVLVLLRGMPPCPTRC